MTARARAPRPPAARGDGHVPRSTKANASASTVGAEQHAAYDRAVRRACSKTAGARLALPPRAQAGRHLDRRRPPPRRPSRRKTAVPGTVEDEQDAAARGAPAGRGRPRPRRAGELTDERHRPVPEREGVAGVEAPVLELVDRRRASAASRTPPACARAPGGRGGRLRSAPPPTRRARPAEAIQGAPRGRAACPRGSPPASSG